MKGTILHIIFVTLTFVSFGQQLPQQTQFMFNQYAFNPAYAGVTDSWEAVANNRYQWIGITDAPRTFTLAAQGPFKNEKMGIGAFVYTDIVGPTRRLGFQASYAYHLQLSDNIKMSMAVSFGFNQWLLDADKITTVDANDPFFSNGLIKTFSPDAKFGLYVYHKDWYIGAALPQLIHNTLNFDAISIDSRSYLEDHFYINGGYIFRIGDDWQLEPTTLIKIAYPAPTKVDLALKVTYKEMVWIGGGFRTNDAFYAMVGYNHDQKLKLGYAYDFTTTALKSYSSGSHELFMAVTFGKTKKGMVNTPSLE
ncbi:MAG: PorP/SprF family type IX secretion system membrane protein [Putridiphycobacter sp.]